MEEINKVRFKDERKLEQEVSELLDEIKQLRKEQAERGWKKKSKKLPHRSNRYRSTAIRTPYYCRICQRI